MGCPGVVQLMFGQRGGDNVPGIGPVLFCTGQLILYYLTIMDEA